MAELKRQTHELADALAEETALIEAAQRGELRAFNTLIQTYQRQAYGVAYRVLGDADGAADATQDAFLKVFRRIHQFHGGSFRAWLFRVVVNTCYDRMRGDQRRKARLISGDDILPEHDYRLIDTYPSPHEHAVRGEMMRTLMRELRKLPKEQQAVLVLCDLEGRAYHEAASLTGANLGTVKSRLSRARAKMRDALARNGFVPQMGASADRYYPRPHVEALSPRLSKS
jgi:RNA polymerase sigma factor (sigma-70 family)